MIIDARAKKKKKKRIGQKQTSASFPKLFFIQFIVIISVFYLFIENQDNRLPKSY